MVETLNYSFTKTLIMKYFLLLIISLSGFFIYWTYNPNTPLVGAWDMDFDNEEWFVTSEGSLLVRKNNTFYATQKQNFLNVVSVDLYSEGTWEIKGGELEIIIEKSNVPFVKLPQKKTGDFLQLSESKFVIAAQGKQFSHRKSK